MQYEHAWDFGVLFLALCHHNIRGHHEKNKTNQRPPAPIQSEVAFLVQWRVYSDLPTVEPGFARWHTLLGYESSALDQADNIKNSNYSNKIGLPVAIYLFHEKKTTSTQLNVDFKMGQRGKSGAKTRGINHR